MQISALHAKLRMTQCALTARLIWFHVRSAKAVTIWVPLTNVSRVPSAASHVRVSNSAMSAAMDFIC